MEKTKTSKTATKKVVAPKATISKAPKVAKAAKVAPVHGVGRRKSAVARVWLRPGKGKITVNGVNYTEYFDTEVTRKSASSVLSAYNHASKYDAEVNIEGGGLSGQADAVKLGFARALLAVDENSKTVLKEFGLLTVDSRLKERKKYGRKAARRGFQFVKR